MRILQSILENWFGFIPRGGAGLIGFVIIIVLVFSLGLLISGDGRSGSVSGDDGHEQAAVDAPESTMWTCSMHPQIKLPKPGKCPICFMDLIPLESGGEELSLRRLTMTEAARTLARIRTTQVRRANVEGDIRMVGKIAYDETRVTTISAWVPGRLDSLYVDYTGMTVKKGDPLIYIYSPRLLTAQEELIQAHKAVMTTRSAGSALKTTAQTTFEAAKEKLKLYGLTASQIENIVTTGNTADHINIYAPAGGVVVEKNALEGMYVNTGTPIYTVADLSQVWVIFEAYESDLPWLREGQMVSFMAASLPGRRFDGIVTFIDPVVNPKSRTIRVRAMVDNHDGWLKPDMFVQGIVRIDTSAAYDVKDTPLLIPASAPLITGTRAVVYVEHHENDEIVFEGREVELGPRIGDFYVVVSGLSEGELVVVNGAFKIDSELQIQARPSMMSPEGRAGKGHQHGGQYTPVEGTAHLEVAGPGPVAISNAARAALTPVYTDYLGVQMALAGDDQAAAVEGYRRLVASVAGVNMSLFAGDAHQAWQDLAATLDRRARDGAAAADITAARERFYHLSKAIIDLHTRFGHTGDAEYYLTFCPMANNNQGAYWLQAVDTVYNSFFGAMMLRCGTIKQALEPYVADKE